MMSMPTCGVFHIETLDLLVIEQAFRADACAESAFGAWCYHSSSTVCGGVDTRAETDWRALAQLEMF
ncbi:hypothetical protein ACFFYR_16160 [Paraburkholderia dipogonis]